MISRRRSGRDALTDYLWPCILLLPLVWLFRRALFFGEMFAYRDSSHYYHPFYRYINERWQAGIPLWNPLDNLGQPLLADPTAAVFYPGKLIFALPLSYELCFTVYVVAHLWLAGCGLYWCAREFRATRQGALVGALAYELSGQVLFQYCNPIFCIGAAWLPFAILLFERTLRQRDCSRGRLRRNIILLAMTLAMMVCGGDPQMAYHFGIIAALRVAIPNDSSGTWHAWLLTTGRNLVPLMSACLIALLLSAIQVLPSIEWARQSDRATRSGLTTVWSLLAESTRNSENDLNNGELAKLWTRSPNPSGHGARVYDFSVGPWRWIELVAPNISGSLFQGNGRWIRLIPGEQVAWVPSLYMGLLPLLLAFRRTRVFGGSLSVRWLTWITILAVAAALGKYGAGWLLNEWRYQVATDQYEPSNWLPGFGGVFWFMTIAFPSYASFRYPAKWWTIAALGIAMLAAKGWPTLRTMNRQTIVRITCGIAAALVAATVTAAILMSRHNSSPNNIFGPLETSVAWRWVVFAAVHALAVLAATWILRSNTHRRRLLCVVVLIDLALAQMPLVQTLPSANWQTSAGNVETASTIYRSLPGSAYPKSWRENSSPDRLSELQTNESRTLMPKHHLAYGTRSLHSGVSMASSDYMALWSEFQSTAAENKHSPDAVANREPSTPPVELLSVLGAERIIAPKSKHDLPTTTYSKAVETNLINYQNENSFPRAWLVSDWSNLGAAPSNFDGIADRTAQIWSAPDADSTFRRKAWIEHDETMPAPPEAIDPNNPGSCELKVDQPERIVIQANVPIRSLLVIRDQFSPGWEAWSTLASEEKSGQTRRTIYRANRVMRAILLEPGEHLVELRYRPKSVSLGLTITTVSMCIAAVILIRDIRSGS